MPRLTSAPLPYTPQPFKCGRLRGIGHPQLVPFFRHMPRVEQLPVEPDTIVYMQRPNIVREVRLPAEVGMPWSRLVVKQFGWRGVQHYLFSPLKRSRAMKAYRIACHLLAHQLGTPLPLGVFEERCWGFVQYNVYVTAAIRNYRTLRQYYRTRPDGPDGIEAVLRLAASYVRAMHDSGVWHRDMTLANFLLAGPPGKRQLYLVDLNRSYRLPYMPMVIRAIDIARMEWWDWQPQFVAMYCGGRYTATRLLWIVRLYGYWRTWRWRVRRVIQPLRRWLRI